MNTQLPRNISPLNLNSWLLKDSQKPLLIDVREDQELILAPFPAEVMHLPLSQSEFWIKTLPKTLPKTQSLVVLCHSGIRSWNFGQWLLEQGFSEDVWNLEGGIDAWSLKVDPKIPRY